jgi:hypothetical protein
MLIEQGFTEAGGTEQAGWSTIAVGGGSGMSAFPRTFVVDAVTYGGAFAYRASTTTVSSVVLSALSSVGTKETYYKFAYYRNGSTSWPIISIQDSAGTTLVTLESDNAGAWTVASGGSDRISSGFVPVQNTWALMELRHINTNPGYLELRIDGISYTYTGTLAVGNGNGARLVEIDGSRDFYIDDLEIAAVTLRYDGGSGSVPVVGEVLTGAAGGTCIVTSVITGDGTSGTVLVHGWNDTDFVDNETLTGDVAAVAVVNAPNAAFVSGFEPTSLWFGNSYCIRADANANGTYSELTNSAGDSVNNYTYIDDTGGSDYVEALVANEKDTYGFNLVALPPDTAVTYGALTVAAYNRSSLVGIDGWKAYARYGGADYAGDRKALTASYIGYQQAYPTEMGTDTKWTRALLVGAELGTQFVA